MSADGGLRMRPELRFVYATATPQAAAQAAALVRTPLDWGLVTAVALRERAMLGVLAAVRTTDAALAASDALAPLRRVAMVAQFEGVHLERRLDETLAALAGAGVTPVLLKGAAASIGQRGTLAGRPMVDLDLLVAPDEVPAAQAVALRTGWFVPEQNLGPAFYAGMHHDVPMLDAAGTQLALELHADLFQEGHPFGDFAAQVRAEATTQTWRGHAIRLPAPHHLLLHTALHCAWSHCMKGAWWRGWHDAAPLLPTSEAGWEALCAAAERMRAGPALYWFLALGAPCAALPVPADVLDRLGRPVPRLLRPMLTRHFLGDLSTVVQTCPSVTLRQRLWELGLQPQRTGHGAIRPWSRDHLIDRPDVQPADHGLAKLRRHAAALPAYTAYLRSLFS